MKHIPNILTMFRILLIGVYLIVFYSGISNAVLYAVGIFLLAGITDVLDGYLARKFNVISKFGQVADPFADKGMQLTTLFTLSNKGIIDKWVVYLIFGKELFLIISSAILLFYKTRIIIPSNLFGKATTVLIYLAIIISVLGEVFQFNTQVVDYIFIGVVIFAGITLIQYIGIGIQKVKSFYNAEKTKEAGA
ncbi:MAG TPA: CDP-alcohol phosphatidyltransferase family protein [Haloplasmataceae bacterium]